jgi:acyl-CoA synthetase (AMP-forming)/AMP-acid ligase II
MAQRFRAAVVSMVCRTPANERGKQRHMHGSILEAPTGTTMVLRALARFPDRRAFVWDGGSLTYRGALDLIGRLQAAMAAAGLRKGQTVALLSANSAETWCAGVAAAGLGLVTTWLHPLGALDDHLDVIEDAEASALIVDPRTHAARGGELASRAANRLAVVLTMGQADFGRDVVAWADRLGEASPISPAPTTMRSSTTPAARRANPRAQSAATVRPRPRRWRSPPTSSFPTFRAISRRHPSRTSPAPRCCRRCSMAARCIC